MFHTAYPLSECNLPQIMMSLKGNFYHTEITSNMDEIRNLPPVFSLENGILLNNKSKDWNVPNYGVI